MTMAFRYNKTPWLQLRSVAGLSSNSWWLFTVFKQ